ncbi:3D domain-containing protein [Desulforamulus ruminis]|uniref:3D domain-containing protein n=1 Tax=Desulforamulus ruminis (strain ATCC 23193 / DSM 2154 / NCIMB 8452 / DL) TaxID=696281 RepID=F6DLY3_DESRL|nr:3D domain-containing protein [Desulforamulus ruminis]AEG58426.1 3D domain-containing protein [Desulforamulus ruminis DSM 2154]
MDWCPVEWPPRSKSCTVDLKHKRESCKKAFLAGMLGIFLLLSMTGLALGYAVWTKEIDGGQTLARVSGYIQDRILGQVTVHLTVDGKRTTIKSTGRTVQEVLEQQGIKMNSQDVVHPARSATLERDMDIKVTRVLVKRETQEVSLPFATKYISNPEMPKGFSKKISEGQAGTELQIWELQYEDGIEVSRTCVSKEIQKEPVDCIIQVGVQSSVSRGGQSLRFSQAYDMLATGYTYTGYKTASGRNPGPGVAAVDPRVVPLGTRLYIEGYGRAVALDTGGMIKGNRIDLFFETQNQALSWGARKTRVYVLE